MNKIITTLVLLIFISLGYTTQAQDQFDSFGDEITADGSVSVDEVIEKLGADTMQVKIKGKVESVCKMKGRWVNVYDSNMDQSFFVKFKDYGFFVPKDCEGKDIVLEGLAYKDVVPVDELRHYAEDAGKTKEEIESITEPQEEYLFMASGALVSKS